MELCDISDIFSCSPREAFALPFSCHHDDAIPQCGFFGAGRNVSFALVGINPGGDSGAPRSPGDAISLPCWEAFHKNPTHANLIEAQTVYVQQLRRTPYWSRNVAPVLQALQLADTDAALFNCMPFRTPDTKWSAKTKAAAARHVRQLLMALGCPQVVALGKLAAEILFLAQLPPTFTWNRGRSEKCSIDRAATLTALRHLSRSENPHKILKDPEHWKF